MPCPISCTQIASRFKNITIGQKRWSAGSQHWRYGSAHLLLSIGFLGTTGGPVEHRCQCKRRLIVQSGMHDSRTIGLHAHWQLRAGMDWALRMWRSIMLRYYVTTRAFWFAIRIDSPIRFRRIDSNRFVLGESIRVLLKNRPFDSLSCYNWRHSRHLCEVVRVTHDDGVELTFDNIAYTPIRQWCAESNWKNRFVSENWIESEYFFLNRNALVTTSPGSVLGNRYRIPRYFKIPIPIPKSVFQIPKNTEYRRKIRKKR